MAAETKKRIDAIHIVQSCRARGRHLHEGRALIVGEDVSHDDARELVKMGRAHECPLSDVKGLNKNATARDKRIQAARQDVEQKRNALFSAQAAMRAAVGEENIQQARAVVDGAVESLAAAEAELQEATDMEA